MSKCEFKAQRRIALFTMLLVFIGVGLIGRTAWIQLVKGEEMQRYMDEQVGENWTLQSPRGAIYDRHGREMAVSIMTKSLYVDPSLVENADTLAADLAPILNISVEEIKRGVAAGGRFVWLKRQLEPADVDKVKAVIEKRGLNCLNFEEESKRYYPNEVLAAQVLGFVGTDDVGLEGIEFQSDKLIKGSVRKKYLITDRNSVPVFHSAYADIHSRNGKSIYLTIDNTVQFVVEQALDRAMQATKPKAITAIVMDTKKGDILAMANRPGYDPNKFYDYSPEEWKNRAVSFVYEPGSTFKAVIAAAALEEGLMTPTTLYNDPGKIKVLDREIENWSRDSYGTVTFTDIIKNSINTGFVHVGLLLGAEKMNYYVKAFGFGRPTGVELPGEESGILFDPAQMRQSDLATMSIGQSIAVTPIQLATAMSAIANGGALQQPHIIKEIRDFDGSIFSLTETKTKRQVIKPETAATLVEMLEQVVASGGGIKAGVKGYRIAGKTGTAEKINDSGGGYFAGHYIASFCGFAPVENPAVTVLVVIDDPTGVYYGGQIAAPVAGEIFEQVLRYLNVQPSADNLTITLPSGANAPKILD